MRVLVRDQPLDLAGRRQDRADRESNLSVEEPGGPRVGARHVPKLAVLVQHDRRSLLWRVGEHPPDALRGRLEVSDDRAAGVRVAGVAVLHDEARRDVALEAGLPPLLALDLLQEAPRGPRRGPALAPCPEVP